MKKEVLKTTAAPEPVGPYSNAVRYGNLVFLSGQTGDGHGSVAEQTTQAMKHIKDLLEDVGSSMDQIVKTTIYISRPEIFGEMNQAYAAFFSKEGGFPARICTYGAKIYDNLDVEIDVIAGIE